MRGDTPPAPTDEDAPPDDIESLFLCTNCGAFVAPGATVCPRCRARFDDAGVQDEELSVGADFEEPAAGWPQEPQASVVDPETVEPADASPPAMDTDDAFDDMTIDAPEIPHPAETGPRWAVEGAARHQDDIHVPAAFGERTSVAPVDRARRALAFDLPPAWYTGPAIAAAAVGMFVARSLGQNGITWAFAFALAALSAYAVAASYSSWRPMLGLLDGLLLIAGASMTWVALGVHDAIAGMTPELAAILAVSGSVPLAWATRRLLRTPARPLLGAAAGFSFIALAVSAAQGLAFAATLAWSLGLLAGIPWPAAVGLEEIQRRRTAKAFRAAITHAERDSARRDFEGTVADYDRAIGLSDRVAASADLPWYGKGAALVLLGRYAEALRATDRALDINPKNEVAWLNKGNALLRMGRILDALRCFNAAIKVSPAYEVAWNNKGNALVRLGRPEEALRCYEQAVAIDPDYREAWVNKGYVLTRLGRYTEAAECADRVVPLLRATRTEPS